MPRLADRSFRRRSGHEGTKRAALLFQGRDRRGTRNVSDHCDHAARDHSRRHGCGGEPQGRTIPPPDWQARVATAPFRAPARTETHPDHWGRPCRLRIRDGCAQGHTGQRPRRFRHRPPAQTARDRCAHARRKDERTRGCGSCRSGPVRGAQNRGGSSQITRSPRQGRAAQKQCRFQRTGRCPDRTAPLRTVVPEISMPGKGENCRFQRGAEVLP